MAEYKSLEAPVHDPQSLPAHVPSKLIGRDVLLARIFNELKKQDAVLLHGEPGIGKTALAATLASAYSELPGGVLWLPVNGASLAELAARIARAYDRMDIANSVNPTGMLNVLQALLNEHKPLLVLDGNPSAQAAADLVTRCAGDIPVLITAPDAIEGPWTTIALPPLDAPQSAALFAQVSGLNDVSTAAPLIDALGGIPFALSVAAGAVKANNQTPEAFLASMPKASIAAPPPTLLALTAAFRGLPNALQGLILVLGATFNGQGSSELLSMISSAPVEGVNQAMGTLVNRNLVERFTRLGSPYYRLHPLVREFAESWLRGSQRLDGLRAKVRDSVAAYASRFSNQHARLEAEIDTFITTSRALAAEGDTDTPNQLAVALLQASGFVDEHGYASELQELRRLAANSSAPASMPLDVPATLPTGATADGGEDEFDDEPNDELEEDFEDDTFVQGDTDEGDEDVFDEDLINDEMEADELEEDLPIVRAPVIPPETVTSIEMGEAARLRAELMQARQLGDQRRQAKALKAIAELSIREDAETEAISNYSEALTQFEAVNDRGEMLSVLHALSELEMVTDNLQAAALHAARGAALADQLGELGKQAILLSLLGDARQQLGESEAAIRAYDQALSLVRAATDQRNEAVLLFKLGYAQLDNNDTESAIRSWETALKFFKEQERRDYEGRVLGGLGTAYGDLERWMESINFHTSALYIAREVKDREEEALQLTNLGFAAVRAKQLGEAVLRYRQALHLAYESGSRDDIVSTTVELANVLIQSPKHLLLTEMLVDYALEIDGNDRDLRKLKERIATDKADAEARGVSFLSVEGTAEEYAEYAYSLLNEI